MTSPSITVAEYNDFAGAPALRDLWRELWWKTRKASFFQSLEWIENYGRHSGTARRLRLLVVSLAGRPVGIVPLVVKSVRSGVGRLRVLTDVIDDRGFFYGPLGTHPTVTLNAALQHVATTRRKWDVLELRQIDETGLDHNRMGSILWKNGFEPLTKTAEHRTVVECRDDWVRYWQSRRAHVRSHYRSCEARLSKLGKLEHIRHRPEGTPLEDDNPRWDLFNDFEIRQFGSFDAGNGKPQWTRREAKARQFFREMHARAAGIAGIDLNVLTIAGRSIAWSYGYRCDGRIEIQRLHCVPEYQSLAPTVLMGRMLRDGFRRGDNSYVFDAESDSVIAGWETGEVSSCRHTYFSPRAPRAQAARFFRWLTKRADAPQTASAQEISPRWGA